MWFRISLVIQIRMRSPLHIILSPYAFVVSTKETTAGTPAYMPPELLAGKPFSKAVDVYMYGVVLWEVRHSSIWNYTSVCSLPIVRCLLAMFHSEDMLLTIFNGKYSLVIALPSQPWIAHECARYAPGICGINKNNDACRIWFSNVGTAIPLDDQVSTAFLKY